MLRATLLLLAISMTALLSGCPGTLVGSPCTRAEECGGSLVCLDGVCRAQARPSDAAILDAARASDAGITDPDVEDAVVPMDSGLDASHHDAADAGHDAADEADAPVPPDAMMDPDAAVACRTSTDCPSAGPLEVFCESTDGTCGGPGVCRARPTRCDALGAMYSPVCGSDCQRYANDCWRLYFGVAPGTGCTADAPIRCRSEHASSCAPGSFCELGTAAARPCEAGEGTCVEIPAPASCDPTPSLVCGCDGRTYTSACDRRAAATSARSDGFCTCERSADCAAPDTFCDRGLAHFAAECAASIAGVCAHVPDGCSVGDVAGDEVATCGSGVVHDDDCVRRTARVESAYAPPECTDGAMPTSGCCFDATDCRAGQNCYGPASCAAAGRCLARPTLSTECYGDADCGPGRVCADAVVDACGGRPPTVGTCVVRADAVFGS